MAESGYVIVRQEAGPFVKAYATDRRSFVRWNHGRTPGEARRRCGPAMCRTSLEKLEIRLALFGYDGIFHTLTFAPEYLPGSFKEAQQRWNSFLKRLTRWRAEQDAYEKREQPTEVDYVYRIEGLHGDHRWHVHCFLRQRDFPSAVVQYLWDYGEAYGVAYDYKKVHATQGYWELARYFTKEVPEVGRHPWGASKTLARQIPAPKVSFSQTGRIIAPKGRVLLPVKAPEKTPWGVFQHSRYLTG